MYMQFAKIMKITIQMRKAQQQVYTHIFKRHHFQKNGYKYIEPSKIRRRFQRRDV